MEHVALLLVSLFFLCRAQGSPACPEQIVSVSADGELKLLPEKRPQGWIRVDWRVRLDGGYWQRILMAEKDKAASYSSGPFSGRAVFQQETLSLRISPVSRADSGVYKAEFENASGVYTSLCFRVLVWEPVRPPRLEARILHWEQGRCKVSLLCTVPGAGNVSYSWSCTGDPPGALEHQPRLHLQVRGDADPTICHCNASNPVSSSTGNVDVDAACRAAAPGVLGSYCGVKGLLCLLVLGSLVAAVAVTHILTRQRGPPSRGTPGSSGAP